MCLLKPIKVIGFIMENYQLSSLIANEIYISNSLKNKHLYTHCFNVHHFMFITSHICFISNVVLALKKVINFT